MELKHAGPNRRERRAARAGAVAQPSVYMTVPRCAAHFGLPVRTLRQMILAGEVPAYSFGSAWKRCRVDEIDRALRARRVAPTSHAAARVAEMLAQERKP